MYATLSMRMQTSVGPQMVMAAQLLRASTEEVEQMLARELVENPAIELARGLPSLQQLAQRYWQVGVEHAADDQLEMQVARQSAVEQLEAQAALQLPVKDHELMSSLLYLLDAHGYLREPPEKIVILTSAPLEQVRRVISVLHRMDPPGIGARDLRECLLIQCAHLQEEGVDCTLPRRILEEAWEDLAGQRLSRVARMVGVPLAEVEAARLFITRNLYPYPLRMVRDNSDQQEILPIPDMVILCQPPDQDSSVSAYWLEIPGEEAFQLRLSRTFELSLHAKGMLGEAEREWVCDRLERARVFITSLEQRWATLRRISEYVIRFQTDFLERGPRWLKPITRAEVAAALGLHESTVSRAVSDKTVMLPDRRLLPLSDLFDASLPVKEALRQMLAEASSPLSDREIAARLKQEGLAVARRTIGKYREQLHIPNCHLRQVT